MSPTRPHKKLKIERQNIFLSAPQKIKKCGFTSTKRQKTKICEQLCFAISKILRGLWWVENTGRNISGLVPPRLHYGTPRYIRTFQKCRVQPFCHQAAGNSTKKLIFACAFWPCKKAQMLLNPCECLSDFPFAFFLFLSSSLFFSSATLFSAPPSCCPCCVVPCWTRSGAPAARMALVYGPVPDPLWCPTCLYGPPA